MGWRVGKVRMARPFGYPRVRLTMMGEDGNLIVDGGIFLENGRSSRGKCGSGLGTLTMARTRIESLSYKSGGSRFRI